MDAEELAKRNKILVYELWFNILLYLVLL